MLTDRPGHRRTSGLRPPRVGMLVALLALALAAGPAAAADPSASPVPSVARANPNALLFLGNPKIAPVLFRSGTGNDGLAADILGAMAQHMGQPVELQLMDWATAQAIVTAGGADALVQINRTPQRELIYDFSDPLLESHFSIFVRSDQSGLATLPSLAGHRVGVEAGGLPAQILGTSAPGAIAVTIPDFATGFRQLAAHEVDAVIVDYRVGSYALAQNGITGIRTTGDAISPSWSAFAVRKGNTALLAEINAALRAIRADGTYDRIIAAWAPTEGVFETQEQVESRALVALAAVLAVLLAVSLLWGVLTWRQVRRARRAEVALDEAQRVAHVGSWSLDRRTGRATVSAELRRMCGEEPWRGSPSGHPSIGDDPDAALRRDAAVAHTLATGEPYELEDDLHRPDGSVRHLVSRGEAVCDRSGAVTGVRGTVADVTELHDAQVRADHAQRAELVGRLAGGVAHDFNNLLASIGGYVGFVEDGLAAENPLRDDLAGIRDATERAASLTRQLLAYGRRQTLRPSVVDVDEMIEGLRPFLRSLCGDAVGLEVSGGDGASFVLADRATLEQAVVNLVLNARDAMPAGGKVRIGVRRVELAADADVLHPPVTPGQYVEVSVADVGTGIAASVLPHIFEPFFSTKDAAAGSGLGLASVEGGIAQSQGYIAVDSEAGRGSIFTVYLPLVEHTEPGTVPVATSAVPAGASGRVLVVEDDPTVRVLVRRMLERLGYEVQDAGDAAVALAILSTGTSRFDIVLTDVLMPGMNGYEMVVRMRELRPDLPAVFMSGYSPDSVVAGGLPADVPFLAKPFTADALAAQIASVLAPGTETPETKAAPA